MQIKWLLSIWNATLDWNGLKAVNYFRKKFRLKCFTGFWICLCRGIFRFIQASAEFQNQRLLKIYFRIQQSLYHYQLSSHLTICRKFYRLLYRHYFPMIFTYFCQYQETYFWESFSRQKQQGFYKKKDLRRSLVWGLLLFFKKKLWRRCFPLNFAKIFKNTFFTEDMTASVSGPILLGTVR